MLNHYAMQTEGEKLADLSYQAFFKSKRPGGNQVSLDLLCNQPSKNLSVYF